MFIEKVKKTVKKYGLFKYGDTVAIGVSGGPDSLTLLYVLAGLKKEFHLKLHVAHLDHMLRRDSGQDRKFVETVAHKLDLPFTSASINVKAIAQKGSLEEICRNVRLGFLFKVSRNIKANKIALGHNLDDQAETVLMRLLRGSGLYGLAGILPKKEISGFTIVRPLIEVKRKEIAAYLKRKKLIPRIDPTNSQDIYFRNKIRHKLLPALEKDYNPNIKEILSHTAESIANDYDFLNQVSNVAAKKLGAKINLKKFSRLHPSVQRMVLRKQIFRLKGSTRRIDFRHIREIEELISNRPVNSIVDLPGNIRAKKTKRSLVFSCS
ncbi:MAG: tRNA lysidine(34) synthetase TilS [Candidatus Omnitrophica bacterium]|nr:tRNA lysidine(34) synthetase TilS [Candidatus Omnitrophota bacterium]